MANAVKNGITRHTLYAMRDAGVIESLSRGIYRLTALSGMTNPDFAIVASRAPNSIICLISALSFHEITTQVPHAVDIAIKRDTKEPRIDYPPTNIYEFSGETFSQGMEIHITDGIELKIYSPEKSIADIFKYRNKLGIDVALEALQMWTKRKERNINELMKYAKICRVEKVIRPYVEALL